MPRVIACLAVIAGCWKPAPAPAPFTVAADAPAAPRSAGRLKVPAAARFGVFDPESDHKILRTTRIELVEDVWYGWRLKLGCTGPVEFREVLRLPAPTSAWPDDIPDIKVSDDRSAATTHSFAPCMDGWIENRWVVTTDDPAGVYVFTVEIPGYETQTFRALMYRDDS